MAEVQTRARGSDEGRAEAYRRDPRPLQEPDGTGRSGAGRRLGCNQSAGGGQGAFARSAQSALEGSEIASASRLGQQGSKGLGFGFRVVVVFQRNLEQLGERLLQAPGAD